MSKKKIAIIAPILLLVGTGATYKIAFGPAPVVIEHKIEGAVVPLQKDFLLNLAGGRYARVAIALVMPVPPPPAEGSDPVPLPQEAKLRAIITDELTGIEPSELLSRAKREHLLKTIRRTMNKTTDEEVDEVLVTDMTVQ